MNSDAAEQAMQRKWVTWATTVASQLKQYGDILVENGIPENLAIRMVEEYHRAIIADYFTRGQSR